MRWCGLAHVELASKDVYAVCDTSPIVRDMPCTTGDRLSIHNHRGRIAPILARVVESR
jgi:hypothetical protein